MARDHPYGYSERTKIMNVEGFLIDVYVVDDLSDEELSSYFLHAFDLEHYEHCSAISAEAALRGINLKL